MGTTEFKYFFQGGVGEGESPPSNGVTTTVKWGNPGTRDPATGEMNTEGFGKGKKGGNAGSACVGDVEFFASVDITGVGDP